MSKRALGLLHEMQDIFGGSFGESSLTEPNEISEAPRPMPGGNPAKGGLLAKKKGGFVPARGEKTGDTIGKKKLMKAAAKAARDNPKHKEKQAADDRHFSDVMRDIRADMDKSKKKSDEKKAAKAGPASASGGGSGGGGKAKGAAGGGGGGGGRHNPFKRSSKLPATDMDFDYVEPEPVRPHHQTKCWNCKCGNIYTAGCKCIASGKGPNCPSKGTEKDVHIDKAYRKRYNDAYHKWRGEQGGAVTRRLGGTRASMR